MGKGTILVVDDETSVRKLVRSYLRKEGFETIEASDGIEAIRLARERHPDLIVLDLMLPGADGLEVCRAVCGGTDESQGDKPAVRTGPMVLMLTARADETDKLVGLGMGADDYLTKPFSPRELVARVKAILRRAGSGKAADGAGTAKSRASDSHESMTPDSLISAGPVEIDTARHIASFRGRPLELTTREFEILEALATDPGIVFSREKLLERVWGYDYFGDPRVVDVHMAKLRKKLEPDASKPEFLKTVRGIGYKLETGK